VTVQTWLVDLSVEQCEDLLARSPLGRLGVIVDGRPEIFPVSHVFDRTGRCVAFPTNERTKLHAARNWPWVAFEVDGLEADGEGGWSVLVVGRAEEITEPEEIERLSSMRRAHWRSGDAVRWIRIVPSKTTGRRIRAVDAQCGRSDDS
jgi:uncharacterized protein